MILLLSGTRQASREAGDIRPLELFPVTFYEKRHRLLLFTIR